jgi:FkbM family methyltransferase
VLAFEPSPGNAALLKSNLERNCCTNVIIVAAAVGRAKGRGSLDTTTAGATHRLAEREGTGDTPVDLVSLDEYASFAGLHIDAVKIDIEGYEPEAFAGMTHLLAERPLLLTEFSAPQARTAGTSWHEPLDKLFNFYGSCEAYDGRNMEVIDAEATPSILKSSKLLNLLFVTSPG